MGRSFIADNSESLSAIGEALFDGTTQGSLDESVQMTRLLECLSGTNLLNYPLAVKHTRESIPDFQIVAGDRKLAIELTKITNQNLGHAKALHRQHGRSVMTTARLISEGERRLPKLDVLQKAYCVSQTNFGPDFYEECEIWKKTALETIDRKSEIQSKETFLHGDEDWLVLMDELATLNAPILQPDAYLLPWLHEQLEPRWKKGWFSRMFIQADHFFRTWMLTKEGVWEMRRQVEQEGTDLNLYVAL